VSSPTDDDTTDTTTGTPAGDPDERPLLHADGVTAGYLPGVDILHECSLELYEGELVTIVGPNGAGKSTLLKSLFGLVDVRDGHVTLRGDDITNLEAHELVERGVGYVPQTENIFPSMTIEENLQMGAYLAPDTFKDRFAHVAELFPMLGERRKASAGSLSGGQSADVGEVDVLGADDVEALGGELTDGVATEGRVRTDEVQRTGGAGVVDVLAVLEQGHALLERGALGALAGDALDLVVEDGRVGRLAASAASAMTMAQS
jgi:branched-chain amino acid transport system ATP-binding protein